MEKSNTYEGVLKKIQEIGHKKYIYNALSLYQYNFFSCLPGKIDRSIPTGSILHIAFHLGRRFCRFQDELRRPRYASKTHLGSYMLNGSNNMCLIHPPECPAFQNHPSFNKILV